MLIAKNDEEKRSKLWRFVTISTTIIILFVVVFFITKLFTGNPLEGAWESDDSNFQMVIDDSSLTVTWDELLEEDDVTLKMDYTLDKSAKTITIRLSEQALREAAEKADGKFTEEKLRSVLRKFTTTFDYSVERSELILTEREYGEQIVFTRE